MNYTMFYKKSLERGIFGDNMCYTDENYQNKPKTETNQKESSP